MPDRRPGLLFHCQHSLGLGHLVRSFALSSAFADHFRVTFLCGGELPRDLAVPAGVEIIPLPPIAADVNGGLLSRGATSLERALDVRCDRVLETFRRARPSAIVVELFPFGRKKLARELVPLLEEARAATPRPAVISSVRDILVRGRSDQERHDELAARRADHYLDAVLVHSDPRFARLNETFRPTSPLRVPVHHTGFVVRPRRHYERSVASRRLVVSAGGGRFGAALFHAALDAHRLLQDVETTIVAGPLLPGEDWTSLREKARSVDGVELRRTVPDLFTELASASVSVSQCGYNTALDIVQANVPALVVPFVAPGEDEQGRRAKRLAQLGAVNVHDPAVLTPESLALEVRGLLGSRPQRPSLDLDGAAVSARIVSDLATGAAVRGAA
jgi:predicted glycosyltransferase